MKNKRWNAKLVAVLADESELEGRSSVFINNNNTPQFFLKIISYEPSDFPRDVRHITCYSDELSKWGFEDDLLLGNYERCEKVKEFLQDSLLVFQPELRYGAGFQEFHVAMDVFLIAKKESFTKDISLIPIPVFKEKDGVSTEEFRSRLFEGRFIGNNPHISKQEEDTPDFLVWKEENGTVRVFGEFESHTVAHGGFRYMNKAGLAELEFTRSSELMDQVYEWEEDYITFFPADLHEDIGISLSQQEKAVAEKTSVEQVAVKEEKTTDDYDYDINREEEWFLQELKDKTREMGLFYSEKDLYNFHTAIKTQSLVILAGMSGTGKSQLVHAYAKALRIPSSQYKLISVRPSWTDDTDLIGYPDTLNNVYRPGDSGLINTLIKAENDKENIFIVCFDEMNLARVEHYFSQFLSVLETDTRSLELYNDDLRHRFFNSEQYKPSITIRENVIFVGTVNIDETTHQFSDKVLDRANVLELEVLPYEQLLEIEEEKEEKKNQPSKKRPIKVEDFWPAKTRLQRKPQLTKQELGCVWEFHTNLQKISSKMGIGPRVVRQIDRYIRSMPTTSPFTRKEAFDKQMVQRVLTKVRGSEDVLLPLVGRYKADEDTVNDSLLFDLFDRYEDVSDFYESRLRVISKARELARHGYTM
ncbi:McrB family protein [Sutcliffiella horikoshii]|uniref:McrB family protein n=1 Tax=Sutcliffiella horikoshii TaxID=79883 RepID=UPI003CE7B6B7